MMTFDLVLPALVAVCESEPGFAQVARACAVRDMHGRVRLVLDPGAGQNAADLDALVKALERDLATELSKYFAAPILCSTAGDEAGRLAREVLNKSAPWPHAGYEDRATGQRVVAPAGRWHLLERRLSKQSWLNPAPSTMLWPLVKGPPPIVTFYSFKGGVGRTTALVSCAWQMASKGKRVVVVDLDLEAPGLGALLDAEPVCGVLDAIIDHVATGSLDLEGIRAPAQALGADDGSRVDVFPAGRLDINYLEKLSRLDFATSGPWDDDKKSPVALALEALLKTIRRKLQPDMILLDARAGLHDLAGLSLHGLAHVDVLVSRASEQAYQGFDLTVRALSVRKRAEDLRCVVVHSFAPRDLESDIGKAEVDDFQQHAYESFNKHVYGAYERDAPSQGDSTAAHFPWVIRQDPDLERFSAIGSVKEAFFSERHRALFQRIEELCRPEDGDDEEAPE